MQHKKNMKSNVTITRHTPPCLQSFHPETEKKGSRGNARSIVPEHERCSLGKYKSGDESLPHKQATNDADLIFATSTRAEDSSAVSSCKLGPRPLPVITQPCSSSDSDPEIPSIASKRQPVKVLYNSRLQQAHYSYGPYLGLFAHPSLIYSSKTYPASRAAGDSASWTPLQPTRSSRYTSPQFCSFPEEMPQKTTNFLDNSQKLPILSNSVTFMQDRKSEIVLNR